MDFKKILALNFVKIMNTLLVQKRDSVPEIRPNLSQLANVAISLYLNTHALKLFSQKNVLSPWRESNP